MAEAVELDLYENVCALYLLPITLEQDRLYSFDAMTGMLISNNVLTHKNSKIDVFMPNCSL